MLYNLWVRFGRLARLHTLRAAAGLGLALIITFAGSTRADDVVFGFAAGIGGTQTVLPFGIAVDSSGNVYTTGQFSETADFDPGPGTAYLSTSGGSTDMFLSKLDSAGNFGWAKVIGATGNDQGWDIAVDSSDNVYTTGRFSYTVDFDPGTGTSNLTSAGSVDIFVTKLDSVGNFVWAKAMGGTSVETSAGIAVDISGNVYTTGWFLGTADFDPGAGTFNLTSTGGPNVFVSKLNSAGNFMWAKAISAESESWDIAVDSSGNVYTTGYFGGTADFDPGTGTFYLTSAGLRDIFVSKLNSAGNFMWAKAVGGTGVQPDEGRAIAVDAADNVYTTGFFQGTADFDPGGGTTNLTSVGAHDVFVVKLDSSGDFVWARAMGGTASEKGWCIAVDSSDNVYTTGGFGGTADFDPGPGTANLTSVSGFGDPFVSKLDTAGNYVWAKAFGSTDGGSSFGIALDASRNVYTTGQFWGTADFDPGPGTAYLTSGIFSNSFISKLSRILVAEAWVDFGFVGSEDGSQEKPYDRLAEGLAAVVEGGTVKIKGNTGDSVSDETMTIDQAVRIEAVEGAVRIGDLGGRSSGNARQSGFVSHD